MRLLTVAGLVLTALFTANSYQQCPAPPAVDWADLTYNHPDQIATRTGILTAIDQCVATVKFPEGDSIQTPVTSLLLGQVGALVGMTVTVRYLKANSALGYISGPFVTTTPTPTPTYSTVSGYSRAGALMKLTIADYPIIVTTTADAGGFYQFGNVRVGKWVTVTPEIPNVIFEPSVWSYLMTTAPATFVNFSSHTYPYPATSDKIAKLTIPNNLTIAPGQTMNLNTLAYDANNVLITPTPTLFYIYNYLPWPSGFTINGDDHTITGGSAGGAYQLQARGICLGCGSSPSPVPTPIVSNAISVTVTGSPGPTPSPTPTPSPSPSPTVTPTPSPSPSPTPTPTPTPIPMSGSIHITVNSDGIGAVIQAVGPQTVSCTIGPNADCSMIVLAGAYTMTADKVGYTFSSQGQTATVPAGGAVEVSFTATPNSTPTPTPTPTGFGVIHVYTNTDGIGALVQAVGPVTASCTIGPGADCAMGVAEGIYAMVANKIGYSFTNQGQSATVTADSTTNVTFVATPVATPTPTPEPTPLPSPSPTPTPSPTPQPCTMTVPDLTMPQWSTTTLNVTLSGTSGVFSVTAVPTTGQLGVSPQSRTLNGTSAVASFTVASKKKSSTITVTSPCGTKVVNVTVR